MTSPITATPSSTTFTGTSQFSSSFQQVIQRAVQIASLPITQLNNQISTLNQQVSALSGLEQTFGTLGVAIGNLQSSIGSGTVSAVSSDSTTVAPAVSAGATPGSYQLEVTSIGSATNTVSVGTLTRVSDPSTQNISNSGTYTLVINGSSHTLSPPSHTLDSLARTINATSGLGVRAAIVNVGSSSNPDYRLSVQGTALNADSMQLHDGSTDLLQTLSTGSNATYKVNGLPTVVNSTSRTITLAPGLTVNLLQASPAGVPSTITAAESSTGIQNSLAAFANAYNAAVDALSQQHGRNAGALGGQGVIQALSFALRQISSYSSGSGGVSDLTSLGLQFDTSGHLNFDNSTFQAATSNGLANALSFLGTNGAQGFLSSATNILTGVTDSTNGEIPQAISGYQQEIKNNNALVSKNQGQVTQLQTNLTAQLARSDALVAQLEQQATYFTNLFAAERLQAQQWTLG